MESKLKTSESITEIALALSVAQGEFTEAKKDCKGNYGKYASLSSVMESVKASLSKHHLAIVQAPMVVEAGRVTIITRLLHKSGQWIEAELSLRPNKDDVQSVGSAITYGKRYSLAALLGVVADDDDDGQTAMPYVNKKDLQKDSNQPNKNNPQQSNQTNLTGKIFNKENETALDYLFKKLEKYGIEPEWFHDISNYMNNKDIGLLEGYLKDKGLLEGYLQNL